MSPTNAMPPAVDRMAVMNGALLPDCPELLQRSDVVGREFAVVAFEPGDS